eukprot:CAMPEP_0115074320 /NCGR_PEP_ID=MMETSP0227-20121206/15277_1 /TAXON_ID=89957 /ORGANISM="Polarella glacialis, Strain CCMP 1383" /LENGTH=32 /DNA_ID= /DNA_START= /DNA_END= /DNA_ORIENTATION=
MKNPGKRPWLRYDLVANKGWLEAASAIHVPKT